MQTAATKQSRNLSRRNLFISSTQFYSLFDVLSNTLGAIYDSVRLLRIEFIHILIEYDNGAI